MVSRIATFTTDGGGSMHLKKSNEYGSPTRYSYLDRLATSKTGREEVPTPFSAASLFMLFKLTSYSDRLASRVT